MTEEAKSVLDLLKLKKYTIFQEEEKINIIGIRNSSTTPNSFDDDIHVLYKKNGNWKHHKFAVSTDPGTYWLKYPMGSDGLGTAILKKGQYINCWSLATIRWGIPELIQINPVTIIRDYNRDNVLDFWSGRETTGLYGINIHTGASAGGESLSVDKWSAGCQVFKKWSEYQEFLNLCRMHIAKHGNKLSYTLLDKRELRKGRIQAGLGVFASLAIVAGIYAFRKEIFGFYKEGYKKGRDYVKNIKSKIN